MPNSNLRLRVTAGPTYDRATHTPVPVNTSAPTTVTTASATTTLHVRLCSLASSPARPLPRTHPYFAHPAHAADRYSFQLQLAPTAADIRGADLVWGNDFDRPVRALLPRGFSALWRLARWVDPGLRGDLRADRPAAWGCVLSSMGAIAVAPPAPAPAPAPWGGDTVLEEDMAAAGVAGAAAARRRLFLDAAQRERFVFRRGWRYALDFFGPWLDFARFELRLPGCALDLVKYWDGQPARYVLRNEATGEVYLCVVMDLVELGEDGAEREVQR